MITNHTAKTLGYSLVSSISEKLSDASGGMPIILLKLKSNRSWIKRELKPERLIAP
jgi:hypothetical protein